MVEGWNALKTTGKRSLGIPPRTQEYNIRTNLKQKDASTRNLIDSSQDMDYSRVLVP